MPIRRGSRLQGSQPGAGPGAPAPQRPPPAGPVPVVGNLVVFEFSSGLLQGSLSPQLPSTMQRYDTTAADLDWISAV